MRYVDINHFKSVCGYEVNGTWYPRVTRIISIKAKPALDTFFKEIGTFASAEEIKDKSAKEGSLIHEVIEKLVRREKVEIPAQIHPAISAFQEFSRKRKVVLHPNFIEKLVWSTKHRYAGTVDALATVDGKFGVLDIKTSSGFWPDYNLQTAAYVSALQELETKKVLALPRDIETRWILRVNQHKICEKCGAVLREKGGRQKIREVRKGVSCFAGNHKWGEMVGDVEIREFPYFHNDFKAFIAAKTLWEWENEYWLKQIGYQK